MGLGCCTVLKVSASYLTKWFIFRMKNNPLSPFLYWAHDDCLDFAHTGDYEVSHSKMFSWHLSKKIPNSQVEILNWRIFFLNKWINLLCYNSSVSGLSMSVNRKYVLIFCQHICFSNCNHIIFPIYIHMYVYNLGMFYNKKQKQLTIQML